MTGEPHVVSPDDLRKLLDSQLDDPVLVLREGRVDVVPRDERAGLEIVSRADLFHTTGQTEFSDDDLRQQAATLSTVTDTLGG